jgi:hypothetical protein
LFFVGSALRLYHKDPRLAELELKESLEVAVEDGAGKKM